LCVCLGLSREVSSHNDRWLIDRVKHDPNLNQDQKDAWFEEHDKNIIYRFEKRPATMPLEKGKPPQ
jgi:hypothetical protein